MIYIIVALLIAIIVLAALIGGRKKCFEPLSDMPSEDVISNVEKLAMSLRLPERGGASPDLRAPKRKIRRAQKVIARKVKRDDPLYGFEKWLYENYLYNAEGIKNRDAVKFAALPHSGGQARILYLADFLLKSCKYELTRECAVEAVGAFNRFTPLYFEEINALPDAFRYCLTSQIAELAQRSVKFDKMERLAKYKKPKVSLAVNDSYVYFLKRGGKNVDFAEKKYGDINADNAEYSFYTTLAESDKTAAAAITSLKSISSIFNSETLISLSHTAGLMYRDDVFASMDTASKALYLEAVSDISDNFNVSEKNVVETAFELACENSIHFGNVLFDHKIWIKTRILGLEKGKIPEKDRRAALYAASVFILDAVFAVLPALLFIGRWGAFAGVAALGLFAFLKLSELCVNKLFSLFITARPVPRMNCESVPDYASTLVVASHLIYDENDLREAVFNLKSLAAVNADENISFCLLIDYAPASSATAETDTALDKALEKLLTGKRFNAFVRKRVFDGKKYCGRERKRGAIEDLNDLLLGGDADRFSYILKKDFETPEFVVLLDADNTLAPSSIRTAVNVMLHPANAEYDLFAFKSRYKLSSIKSPYSLKFLSSAGTESYNSYGDFYYNLTGNAVYSGKGIYRLKSFAQKLKGKLPENRILSHDVIEGALVKTACFNEPVYEDAPSGFFSETERQNRWSRGDLQLLPFIKNSRKDEKNNAISLKKPLIYNYIMFSNAISVLAPVALLGFALAWLIGKSPVFLIAPLLYYAAPLFLEILAEVNALDKGRRARYALTDIGRSIVKTVFDILLLPFYAINNLMLTALTFYRIGVSKKNLLEWKTFKSAQSSKGKLALFAPSFIVFAALCGVFYANIALAVYTLVFYAACAAVTVASRPLKDRKADLGKEKNDYLLEVARNTYAYFSELSNENNNFLICDNYQLSPFKGAAERTSPTNIGFLLLSHVCAEKLGFIDAEEARRRIARTLETVKKLKKFKGNLYNWYDTKTLEVLKPKTVSSVDSANFAAALLAVKRFAKAEGFDGIAADAENLFEKTSLGFFYDEDRGLFRIAYDARTKKFEGYYDMLASESRLLSFLAVAKGVAPAAWGNLSRDSVSAYGNTLLSWSGTAFEYLLPQLFLDDVPRSLLTRSVKNAVKIQCRNKCRDVFGVSESAFYKFDAELNYQYYAFGLESLSLRTEFDRCVIAPYATMLALPYAPEKCFENLTRLKNEGLSGRYGFFEAVDYTDGKNVVYSHMAHHQGMSLAAATNYLANGYIRELFMGDELAAGARPLIEEAQITRRTRRRRRGEYVYQSESGEEELCERFKACGGFPKVTVLTSGDYTLVADEYGNGYSSYKDVNVTRFRKNLYEKQGVFAYFKKEDGTLFSTKASPLGRDADKCEAVFGDYSIEYRNLAENASETVVLPYGINGELRLYTLKNDTEKPVKLRCALYAELSLNSYEADFSHPVFDNMFIKTYEKDGFTVAKRRLRSGGDGTLAAFGVFGADLRPETDKFNFIGRLRSASSPDIFDTAGYYPSLGDVLEPCFGASGEIEIPPKSEKTFYAVMFADENERGLEYQMERIVRGGFLEFALSSTRLTRGKAGGYLKSQRQKKLTRKFAAKLLYEPFSAEKLKKIAEKNLLAHIEDAGLDKTKKTLYFDISNQTKENVADFLRAYSYLWNSGIKSNLILVCGAGDCETLSDFATDFLSAVGVAQSVKYISAKGAPEGFLTELKTACFAEIFGNLSFAEPTLSEGNVKAGRPAADTETLEFPDIAFRSGNGGFDAEGNYIVKSKRPTMLPYSNVIAMGHGGTVATENGGGFTFAENSREEKLTAFSNSPVNDRPSEGVYFIENGFVRRLNKGFGKNAYTLHERGKTTHVSLKNGVKSSVSQYMIRDGRVKIYDVTLYNRTAENKNGEIVMNLTPSLFWRPDGEFIFSESIENGITATNAKNGFTLAAQCLGDAEGITDAAKLVRRVTPAGNLEPNSGSSGFNNACAAIRAAVSISAGDSARLIFAIAAKRGYLSGLNKGNIDAEARRSTEYFESLGCVTLDSGNPALDSVFNVWLPAQIVSSRLNGRCGYYQAGGAIGFRDQLQDCLAMLYIDQDYVRRHILLCAAHQFEEGDVQHWWHPPFFGVRTRISDDMLFLPLLCAEYIEATGDRDILEEEVDFIVARKPEKHEEGALENAVPAGRPAPLSEHVRAAVDCALKFGEHDLLKIGGGDWNDALNAVGNAGRGESVWLSMFAYWVIKRILPYFGDEERKYYSEVCERLKNAVDGAYENGRYKRAFTDSGEWLGSDGVKCDSLDLIAQAFAVISGIAPQEKRNSALARAERLVDYENGIIKLFSPPFDGSAYYGYIGSYPQGVRENGGQYTHGAAWLVKAFAQNGDVDKAFELFNLLNPAEKCSTDSGNFRYKGEPYVFAGDVYVNADNFGRAGWSWYTGSAAWLYKTFIEDILGIKLDTRRLVFRGTLPKGLRPTVRFRYKTSEYVVKFILSDKKRLTVNGIENVDGGKLAVPLFDNGKTYSVEVYYTQ